MAKMALMAQNFSQLTKLTWLNQLIQPKNEVINAKNSLVWGGMERKDPNNHNSVSEKDTKIMLGQTMFLLPAGQTLLRILLADLAVLAELAG